MVQLLRRFRGQVEQQASGFALVRYDDLQQDIESEVPLREWFRVPGAPASDPAAVLTADPVHGEPGYLLRPEPPAEVCPRAWFNAPNVVLCSWLGCVQPSAVL